MFHILVTGGPHSLEDHCEYVCVVCVSLPLSLSACVSVKGQNLLRRDNQSFCPSLCSSCHIRCVRVTVFCELEVHRELVTLLSL